MQRSYDEAVTQEQSETCNPFEELLNKKQALQPQGHSNMEELLSKFSVAGYGSALNGEGNPIGVMITVNGEEVEIRYGFAKEFCCCGNPKGVCNTGPFFTISA